MDTGGHGLAGAASESEPGMGWGAAEGAEGTSIGRLPFAFILCYVIGSLLQSAVQCP